MDKAWAEFDTYNDARIKQFKNLRTKTSSESNSKAESVSGALSQDSSTSSSSNSLDLSSLLRNSYIAIGLFKLGGIIALLLLVIAALFASQMRGGALKGRYKPVSGAGY